MVWRVETCAICGEEFGSEHKGGQVRKYCSDECVSSSRRKTKLGPRTQICGWCGKEFEWNYQGGALRKYCDSECKRLSNQASKRKAAPGVRQSECVVCGKIFEWNYVRGVEVNKCSPECRSTYIRSRWNNWYSQYRKNETGDRVDSCRICGRKFEWHYSGGALRRYCSLECLNSYRSEYNRKYKLSNASKVKTARRSYYLRNKERCNLQSRAWYRSNLERVKANHRRYYRLNKEKYLESWARRRARKAGAYVESVNRSKVLDRDSWTCQICGGKIPRNVKSPHPLSPHIDHIIPLSEGGKEEYANVQAAHASCNIQKGARLDGWQDIKPIVDGEENHYHS